jgi:hypothetical protein
VAVIASNLSAAAQDRAREAVARRHEVTRLFDLTRDVLLTTETAGAIDILARHVAHGLIAFAKREGITHVCRPDRAHAVGDPDEGVDAEPLMQEVGDAAVQVVPLGTTEAEP